MRWNLANVMVLALISGLLACQTTEEKFVQANQDELSLEMAQGEGKKLDQLALMHGCQSAAAQTAFRQMTQTSYGQIYSGAESTSREILQNLRTELQGWDDVQAMCNSSSTAEQVLVEDSVTVE